MTREKGKEYLSSREIGLPLNREEADIAHKQMVVYKGKGGKPHVKMKSLILTGHVNQVNQRGLLITGVQYFNNWTLVISHRRRKWSNTGIDLGC